MWPNPQETARFGHIYWKKSLLENFIFLGRNEKKKFIENSHLKPHRFLCDQSMTENLCTDTLDLGSMNFLRALLIWEDTFWGDFKVIQSLLPIVWFCFLFILCN